ncbi:YesL family protein, partial [Neobacillus drentensis]|uniref:YesL family protein n=1 Tax=Neobacillus drentensis TaxID=220684 RepID=UPI003000DA48
MKGLFNLDGPLYKFCVLVYETFMLNLLWFIGSLPIVTIGVSTSALYYVYGKKVRDNGYYIYSDFIKGYKENFKQALPIGAVITIILSFSIYNIFKLNKMGSTYLWLQGFQLFIIFQ